MDGESWKRLKSLYAAALELPFEEREEFIVQATEEGDEVRQEALAMLRATVSAPDFLESPARVPGSATDDVQSAALPKGQIVCQRFRVEEFISEGGMGKIYRATDLELNRTVALKTIRSGLLAAEHLRLRLRQEAQVVSKLNHPAICTLYDVRSDAGADYLVMEFLEGESLAKRLSKGPIPLEQCINIALEVLAALNYAHKEGIIHRDIKPGNVMLTKSGAKLLDFGIAKVRDYDHPEDARFSNTPQGFVHGTPPYMAPERFQDGTADGRSDIYAFGVMFGVMLSHPKIAPGPAVFDPKTIPPPFRAIVEKCLCENPAERWQDAGDLKAALELVSPAPIQDHQLQRSRKKLKLVASLMTALTVVSAALLVLLWSTEPRRQRIEFQIFPPDGSQFLSVEHAGPPVISPDGSGLTFVARDSNGVQRLWLRKLDSLAAVPLTGTEGATHPFWSPDSRSIGFFARDRLMTLEIGRTPKVVCLAREGRGATWNRDGVIVFSPSFTDALFRVAAGGGVAVPITTLNVAELENSHRWPTFLPDGKHVLFVLRTFSRDQSGLYVVSIDGSPAKRIPGIESSAVYTVQEDGHGYLLYERGTQVIAQEFNIDKLELTGEPAAVAELGWTDTSTTRATISVSDNGVLAFGGGQAVNSQLLWTDARGTELSRLKIGGTTRFLRLSPNMQSVAIERLDFRYGSGSLWVFESERERATRFTFDPMSAYAPVWSPDGQSIAFTVHKGKGFDLMWKSLDDASTRILKSSMEDEPLIPTDWTADGWILYEIRNPKSGWDIFAVSANQPEIQRLLVNSSADERQARVSPNGEWMAYNSNESGVQEVYVQRFLRPGPRFEISTTGGSQPVWHRDSNKVFFIDSNRMLMSNSLDFRAARADVPQQLFRLAQEPEPGLIVGWEYDVAADGTRFLTGRAGSLQESKPLSLLHGWQVKR